MVQTPQGLVAQPIQIQTITEPLAQGPGEQVVHGSTTLGSIGTPPTSSDNSAILSQSIRMVDEDYGPKRNPKRGILPKSATRVMKSWLFQHIIVRVVLLPVWAGFICEIVHSVC